MVAVYADVVRHGAQPENVGGSGKRVAQRAVDGNPVVRVKADSNERHF